MRWDKKAPQDIKKTAAQQVENILRRRDKRKRPALPGVKLAASLYG
jgi:hypothetical protein